MIPSYNTSQNQKTSKPRASGDDPDKDTRVFLDNT